MGYVILNKHNLHINMCIKHLSITVYSEITTGFALRFKISREDSDKISIIVEHSVLWLFVCDIFMSLLKLTGLCKRNILYIDFKLTYKHKDERRIRAD